MKRLAAFVAGTALAALAAGCATKTANTNIANNANSNTAVLVNNNANTTVANANANTTAARRRDYNRNISEADYERDKARYGSEAKESGDTVGSGLKDGWLWVKAKGQLATVDDLRDSTINVDVDNAVVTLRGSVASAAGKAAAEKAAKAVDGVKSVRNQLLVKADGSVMTTDNANTNRAANHNGNMNHK